MAKTYAQIMKQIQSLEREAEALRRKEAGGVIARIKEAIAAYGLTASDLGLSGSAAARTAGPRPGRPKKGRGTAKAKYRDEAGNVWGGRGPRPRWLRDALAAGKRLEDFAV